MDNNIRYKEAFLLIDEENIGVIHRRDVHFLIRALGYTPTKNDLEKIDKELMDNQTIDYLWFIDIMSRITCTKYSYEQIENAFYAFDKNRYGKKFQIVAKRAKEKYIAGLINLATFKRAMMNMGEPLSEQEMNEMMKDLPVDEDGFIEYENFCLQFKSKEDPIVSRSTTEEKK